MKNAKRWLAVILAVTLLGSNAIYQLGTTLSANETEAVTESQQDESENAVAEQAEKQQEDTGKATVQEVTPQEDKSDASAQEASNEQAQQSQPAQAEANTQEAAPANAGQSEPEANQVSDGNVAQAETPVAQTYDVKINKPELDGGQIKVWGTDGIQTDVTSYDGNNQYVKEVTEGEDFNFQITRNDGFEIENVTVNGAQIAPESTDGNVSTYKLSGVAEEKAITITYNKVETPVEDEQTPEANAGDEAGTTGTENDANVSGDEPTKVIENLKPARTLSETVDGTIVTVSAPEGALEDGWTLQVKKVSVKSIKSAIEDAVEDADAIEEIKAFDITIYGKDGNAIQPDGSVQVSFSGTGIKGDAAEVYHVDDSKKKAEKVCDATTNSKVEFEAEHFSIYAVVGSNTVYANTKDTAYKVAIGSKLTLKSDNYKNGQEWNSDNSSIVKVVESGTTGWMDPQPYAIVEAKSEGTTFVKYNKEKFYITVTKANGTLSFDLNGGTGTKPADITGENGESVTLPTGNEITRENYTFLGWSTEKDANLVTSNGKAVVYPAGGTFEVSGKTTLYAVWAQSAGKLSGKIAIAIRKDGTIPGEPSLQYASYTFLTSSRGNSTLMSVDNVLDYINPAQTMVGKSNVESVLQPTFYSYVNNKNANGTYWNNATQYVEWYVVKYQNSDYAYHIDGVVRNKQNVYLDYDGNGYTDGLVPNGVQLVEGGSTTVSQAGNYYNGNSDWRDLKKAGYTFIGWNTSADGKGTSYQPGASITVRENTTLYAQWKAKGYTVKYDSDGGSAVADKNLKFADEVDVSATPTKDGYIFKGWYYNESEVKDATYASLVNDDESVQEITLKAKWQQKDGRFGYYLSLASADWKGGMPDNLEVSGTSGQGLPKYAEKVHYTYGDKYNVISNVPEAEGHAFIGWLDKKRGNQSAAIRTAGDELTYIYKAGDENQAYTLDALWASIAAKGGTYPYNGSSRQITADVAINEGLNLNAEYVEQAKKFIKTGKMEYSTDNKNWSEENPGFTDAGTYTVYVRQDVTVGGTTTTLQSSAQIVINPRSVELTSATDSKMYDGKALTKKEVTVSGDGFIEGEGATYNVTGSQKVVGSSENTFTYTLTDVTKAQNYHITMHNGTLTVTNRDAKYEITVKANSTTGTYNGTEYSATGLESTTFTVDGNVYTVEGLTTEDPVKKDAGTYTNNITGTAVVKDAAGNDVSSEFTVNTENGSLKIKKAEVTLKSATLSKVYEGTALVNGTTALETEEGWAEADKDSVVYNFTGSQTYVGSSENIFSVVWNETVKESNYNVAIDYGTLTVTPQSIVPDPDPENPSYKGVEVSTPADVPYNGQDQTWEPTVKDAEGKALVKDTDYTVSYDKDDRTNVTGTITVTITGNGNYTGTVTRTYQITPKPVTITTNSNEKVFDNTALTADGSVEGIVEGETYSFTVTGSQTWVGRSANTYEMVWDTEDNHYTAKQSNYVVSENVGTLTVTDGTPETPVDPSLVVNKTHEAKADGTTFKAGDVITFTITVKNIYDEVKTITLVEQAGVTLDQATFENVQPGAEITATATYTVTEADIVNGTFTNNVTARFSGVDKEYTGTDTVDKFEESRPHMTITKVTKDAGKDHIYKLGETINYVITVKNDGNLTLTNVKIEDALTGNAGENAWTIDTFAPGETQTFEASYVVTEADVIAGKVVNNATGEAENPDPKKEETPVTPGEKEDPVETPNPGLTVVKTSDTEGQVTLGQKIPYTITVTNNGNVTISGVKLVDPLTRDNWTIDKIKPGETVTKKTTYTVTEKDIIAGKVENHATATGKDPSGNDVTGKGDKTVETEPSNPHITVTKETTSTPKNGETYALGEEITYKITAKNTGNLTLKDVVVSDELTGNTGDKAFKIDGEFKPGDEKSFETSYTVKESDLGTDGKGSVLNVATATGTTPDEKKPKPGVDPGKTEDPTDQKKPSMSIEKKVIDQKEKYEIGDTVKYEITVTNTGNTTQNNILVEDQMSAAGQAVITKVDGANGTIDGAKVTLDTLAPGKAATITAEYTVVKADRGNTITNAAVAKGEGENPKTPNVPVVVEKVYDIHVVHAFAPGNEGNVALPDDYTIENVKPKTVKRLMAKGVTGYVAYPAVQNATVVDRDITVTFLYYKDEIGTDPTNPDKPDGVPDEFQAVVRFAAVNGSVSIDHAVVTLFGEDGKPAKNGVGHLSALQIAAATANAGYNQASLSWAPQAPTMDYNITGDMTFTATFTATPVTPPATPDNPRPNNPTRPSGQTTEPTGNAFVDNVVTPVVETVKEKAAKIQEVFNSDDEDVPLADQNLDNHKCCILHFLIMLITLLVYALATKSMKKRQKKLHEVREELDCELARRGLPLSREKE